MSQAAVWRITRARWQWQPTTTAHDPYPPLTLETGGPAYFGTLKRWTGASWLKAPLRAYVGGAFQAKPLKRWTGAAWVQVDTTGV